MEILRPNLEGESCTAKQPLPVEYKVAALLLRLASGDGYWSISELLGIGESPCCQMAFEAACAVMAQFGQLVSRERYGERLASVQKAF